MGEMPLFLADYRIGNLSTIISYIRPPIRNPICLLTSRWISLFSLLIMIQAIALISAICFLTVS